LRFEFSKHKDPIGAKKTWQGIGFIPAIGQSSTPVTSTWGSEKKSADLSKAGLDETNNAW
jgi:hypothetical protein